MSKVGIAATAETSIVETLRRERDRFVALAFCAADILFEVGDDHKIVFAAGATTALTGVAPEKFVGQPLLDVIAAADRPLLGEIVDCMTAGNRLEPVVVHLKGKKGVTRPLLLTGYLLPELPGSLFFALRLGSEADERKKRSDAGRDKESGLHQADGFAKQATAKVRAAKKRGEDVELTMVRLQNFSELRSRLDDQTSKSLLQSVGACLRVGAGAGDAAGRFDDENYGIVHQAGADIASLKRRIESHIKTAAPDGGGISVETGTVATDLDDASEADVIKALQYTIRQFCDEDNVERAKDSLSGDLHAGVEEASRKMTDFREMVSGSNFDVAFQPIVTIATRQICHFEALARFGGGSDRSPYELITFAENTGLICDFDYAMCEKLIDWLHNANKTGQRYSIALNLSGHSVTNTAFLAKLQGLLKEHDSIRQQLIIEITESARIKDLQLANQFIQSLRKSGHTVCLDDFGAGSAALRYLHDLDVDVVKIDGQYIQGAVADRKNRAFLRAISSLCRELEIVTVAEMVEDEETVKLLMECGIELGQGYLFGRPSTEISAFEAPRSGGAKPLYRRHRADG